MQKGEYKGATKDFKMNGTKKLRIKGQGGTRGQLVIQYFALLSFNTVVLLLKLTENSY